MTDPRAIALLTPGWPPAKVPNGIVAYTACIRDAMRSLGVDTRVLTPTNDGPAEPGVEPLLPQGLVARAGRALRRRLAAIRQRTHEEHVFLIEGLIRHTRRLHRDAGVRVLEMEESFGWPAQVARAAGVPVVVRLHGPWFLNGEALGEPDTPAFRARVERERIGILAGAAVSAPSQDVLDRTRAYYKLPLPDAQVIPCPAVPAPTEHIWDQGRADPSTLLFIGRFDRHKGGDLVIDAFARLAPEWPKLRLIFAGPDRGLAEDGRTVGIREYLERVPEAIRQRINWMGPQPHHTLAPLRLQPAMVLVASRYENFAYAVLEGMSQGCAMIAARAGGLPEMIQDGRNGLLFPAGDANALADRIATLLRDPRRAAILGAQARADAAARYDPILVAQRTLDLYRRVI